MKPRNAGGRGRDKSTGGPKRKPKETTKSAKPATGRTYKKTGDVKDTRPENPWVKFESKGAPTKERNRPFDQKSPTDKPYGKSAGGYSREEKPYKTTGMGYSKSEGDKPVKRSSDKTEGYKPFKRGAGTGYSKSEGDKPAKRAYDKTAGDKPFKRAADTGDKPYKRTAAEGSFSKSADDKPFRKPRVSRTDSAAGDKPYKRSAPTSFSKTPFSASKTGKPGDKPYSGRKTGESSYKKPLKPAKSRDEDKDWNDTDEEILDWETKPAARLTVSKTSKAKRANNDDGTRLNKYIVNTGICSRREADDLIKAGAVMVNGVIITEMGFKISPTDEIRYGGQTLRRERPVYVLLNKPKDYITTTDDPMDRRTVMALVKDACRERIYPVGRLDRETTGLLLLTNDGEITKKLTHPSYGIKKIYHVELDKKIKLGDLQKIAEGIELEDGFIKVDEISTVGDDKTQVGVEIHSGRNRIVRRIFEHMGYSVKKLDRVYFAGLTKKDLPRGRYRILTEMEVNMLRMLTGKKK